MEHEIDSAADRSDSQPDGQRRAIVSLLRRRLDDADAREWLLARLKEQRTTWKAATRQQLKAIALDVLKLPMRAQSGPEEPAEPVGDRNVLQEIADERITAEQIQQVQDLAHQYGVDALALVPMLEAYGAKELTELKDLHYRALLGDIIRSSGAHRSAKRRQ